MVVWTKRCTWLEEAPCFHVGLVLNSDGQLSQLIPIQPLRTTASLILYIAINLMNLYENNRELILPQ